MKKLLGLLLAAALLLSLCSLAAAEEAVESSTIPHTNTTFPFVDFGSAPEDVINTLRERWVTNMGDVGEISEETRTLENGEEITVYNVPITGSAGSPNEGLRFDTRLYVEKSKVVACAVIIPIPEGIDGSMLVSFLTNYYGQPTGKLSTEEIGTFEELLGEDTHLEDGQDLWNFKMMLNIPTEIAVDISSAATIDVCLTARVEDGVGYIAGFPDVSGDDSATGTKLSELAGYENLTEEDREQLRNYAEYLENQKKTELEKYIEFLAQKHK